MCGGCRRLAIRSGVLASILAVLGNPRLLTRGVELLGLAIREFFLPQFESRLFPGSRPVLTIAHPLDERIPFVPTQVQTYLGFIGVWVEGLGALYRCFGSGALADMDNSIRDLCRLYRAAGSVYRRCQTTTRRVPGPWFSPHFLLIRLFDPHLHCVPSLHVLIVCCNYLRLRQTFRAGTGASGTSPASEAYRAALRVIRSTLLVKQHSLADIGPSLFLLSELFPEYDRSEVQRFVSDLVGGFSHVPPRLRVPLREAVLADYRAMKARSRKQPDMAAEDILVQYLQDRGERTARSAPP